ncbi:MAG TPA: gliding motility-associated C-terminal domain-containing protein [Bacteroidales bacterium]|nr:gliding motility-associated C-terminal domain-containing protein [Bacteroidales bacterium]
MTGKSVFYTKSFFIGLFVIVGQLVSLYSQDKKIGGIVNSYKRVEAIGSSPKDNVTLNDVAGLVAGDTVLLIQMKGAIINVPEASAFGIYQDFFGAPGQSEFLIIESIDTGTKNVKFTAIILNDFDAKGLVQLVKVPFYNTATVTSTLTCQPWDSVSKTGGVLVMIVGRTLSLNANIDVEGKGFKGGMAAEGAGLCTSSGAGLDNFGYPASYDNSGYKGESVAQRAFLDVGNYPPFFPNYAKGKGDSFTGGGGGNGRYSGGGGGSNWGTGGQGGKESGTCSSPVLGGNGSQTIKNTEFDAGFIMGGGGGGSTYAAGVTTATPGAAGGGIIIIICDTIKGNGRKITAAGGSPNTLYPAITNGTNAGAGGGGGGGSVAIYLQSYSSSTTGTLTISVDGGQGGSNMNVFNLIAWGEGGGGGSGLILTNNIAAPSYVTKSFKGGKGGFKAGTTTGSAGTDGEALLTYSPVLNGFLYNSIRSAVTGDQTDSICSNVPFGIISGTIPFGGTFQWQKSTLANPTVADADWSDISGATSKDYSPGLLTQTTWFRRVVTQIGTPTIVDKSKPVQIIVQLYIKNNIIGDADTICYAQNPQAMISKAVLADGNGIYSYKWEKSTDNSVFTDPANNDSLAAYTPEPTLTQTSWYRRIVTSGRCQDKSTSVKITVLDTIRNNRITVPAQDICYGMTFTNLTGTTPSTGTALGGGDNSYRYLWISSINGAAWGPAPGTNNLADYDPAELAEKAPKNEYKYMRIVKSGMQDVCADTTSILLLRDYPVLTNNKVLTAQHNVCSGSAPSLLTGSDPANGDGTYIYIWQDSTKANPAWTDISGATQRDYQPPALTDTTSYRRKVTSSACIDISKSVRVNVHKPLINNIIALAGGLTDTTICDGANPNSFTGSLPAGGTNIAGDYAYEWQYSADNISWNAVSASGTGKNYDPPALNSTTFYRRKVLSGACTDISAATLKVTVLPLIANNILNDPPVICKDYVPAILTGATPTGGDGSYKYYWEQSTDGGSSWAAAAGVNNLPSGSYEPPALGVPTKYRRKVSSGSAGCCSDISNIVEVRLHTDPSSSIYAGPDTTLRSFDGYYVMEASPLFSYETGKWSVILGAGSFTNDTKNDTEVRDLGEKDNLFLWTVKNGPCINTDSVRIAISEIFVPEGFSPNGDDVNDYFEILGLDTDNQDVEISIVNSAGTEVFHSTNMNSQDWMFWDGKNTRGNDLAEGTYYYILKMASRNTDKAPYKQSGFIVLKRK